MSIPLVQNNEKDSINTSIIAIKRNIERINMLLGLSNSEEIDTSKFATKEELQQAVTDLQPVDEVALNNMQSVTSNAVAKALPLTTSASQVIWSGGVSYGPNTNSAILGAYGYGLFDIELPYPSGYHKEFVLTAQITTDAGISARVRLNNIATNYTFTWSGNKFRNIVYSQPFRYEDIIL